MSAPQISESTGGRRNFSLFLLPFMVGYAPQVRHGEIRASRGLFSRVGEGRMKMRKVIRFFLSIFFISILFAFSARAQIVINEFVADPAKDWDGDGATNYRDDEWIEILNLGPTTVDLSSYRLSDGEGPRIFRYGFAGSLAPGAVKVVFGSDSRAWEESNGFPVYGLSLNNTGDRVALYRIVQQETIIVDSYVYSEIAAKDDRSIGRSFEAPSIWITFDALNPCTSSCNPAGTGCMPTPGLSNTCQTSAEKSSWGAIKGLYDR